MHELLDTSEFKIPRNWNRDLIWKLKVPPKKKKKKRETLNSALGAMVKMIKIETLHWEMVKSKEFNFLKVKTLLNSI